MEKWFVPQVLGKETYFHYQFSTFLLLFLILFCSASSMALFSAWQGLVKNFKENLLEISYTPNNLSLWKNLYPPLIFNPNT